MLQFSMSPGLLLASLPAIQAGGEPHRLRSTSPLARSLRAGGR